MRNNNVCKFIIPSFSDTLFVSKYIKETNEAVMKTPAPLSQHRMILITQGEGEFVFSQNATAFKRGDIVFGLKGENMFVQNGKQVTYLYIDFSGTRAEDLLKRFEINENNRVREGNDGLIPLWEESLLSASEQNLDLTCESILLYTFSRFYKTAQSRNEMTEQIIEITEHRFNEPTLSISVIASELSYNAKYLSHTFKKSMGVNYSQYLRTIRIKHAITLLAYGIDSIKNVAILSGFTDPLYFSNVFKAQIGISPTQYLKNSNENNHLF